METWHASPYKEEQGFLEYFSKFLINTWNDHWKALLKDTTWFSFLTQPVYFCLCQRSVPALQPQVQWPLMQTVPSPTQDWVPIPVQKALPAQAPWCVTCSHKPVHNAGLWSFMVISTYPAAAVCVAWPWEKLCKPTPKPCPCSGPRASWVTANFWALHTLPGTHTYFTTSQHVQQQQFAQTAPRDNVCIVLKCSENTSNRSNFCEVLLQTRIWDTWISPQIQEKRKKKSWIQVEVPVALNQ